MKKMHKKICTSLNYSEHSLILDNLSMQGKIYSIVKNSVASSNL